MDGRHTLTASVTTVRESFSFEFCSSFATDLAETAGGTGCSQRAAAGELPRGTAVKQRKHQGSSAQARAHSQSCTDFAALALAHH